MAHSLSSLFRYISEFTAKAPGVITRYLVSLSPRATKSAIAQQVKELAPDDGYARVYKSLTVDQVAVITQVAFVG